MKADLPRRIADFFNIAENDGFFLHKCVARQCLGVISLDQSGPILRFFSPDIRVFPEGTQVGGNLGVALSNFNGSNEIFDVAIFHNILNELDLLTAERKLEDLCSMHEFLNCLKIHLNGIPGTLAGLLQYVEDGNTWLSRQMRWDDPQAKAFGERLKRLRYL